MLLSVALRLICEPEQRSVLISLETDLLHADAFALQTPQSQLPFSPLQPLFLLITVSLLPPTDTSELRVVTFASPPGLLALLLKVSD